MSPARPPEGARTAVRSPKVPRCDAASVLAFWFGPEPFVVRPEWFRKDPAFDESIRQRFGPLVDAAIDGGIDAWHDEPQGALARLIVLDQFTRNLFRGSARAFAGDPRARAAVRDLIARGWDVRYAPMQRRFVYLPFEHSEDIADQHEGVRRFEQLAADAPECRDTVEWAVKHRVVIERFGRFPHRNAALGRTSTAEEIEYLRQPGSGF